MAMFRCGGENLKQEILDTGASGMWISDLYLREASVAEASTTTTKTWTSDGDYYVIFNINAGNTGASYNCKKNNTSFKTTSGRGGIQVTNGDTISIAITSKGSSSSAVRYKNINAFKIPLHS